MSRMTTISGATSSWNSHERVPDVGQRAAVARPRPKRQRQVGEQPRCTALRTVRHVRKTIRRLGAASAWSSAGGRPAAAGELAAYRAARPFVHGRAHDADLACRTAAAAAAAGAAAAAAGAAGAGAGAGAACRSSLQDSEQQEQQDSEQQQQQQVTVAVVFDTPPPPPPPPPSPPPRSSSSAAAQPCRHCQCTGSGGSLPRSAWHQACALQQSVSTTGSQRRCLEQQQAAATGL